MLSFSNQIPIDLKRLVKAPRRLPHHFCVALRNHRRLSAKVYACVCVNEYMDIFKSVWCSFNSINHRPRAFDLFLFVCVCVCVYKTVYAYVHVEDAVRVREISGVLLPVCLHTTTARAIASRVELSLVCSRSFAACVCVCVCFWVSVFVCVCCNRFAYAYTTRIHMSSAPSSVFMRPEHLHTMA